MSLPTSGGPGTKKESVVSDHSIREVERGSRIVVAVPFDSKVVLQLPRGNLEAIYPTVVLVDMIRTLLSENVMDYKNSFVLMRKHRIDMNLFYDHNPLFFMDHVEDFVRQLNEVDAINLFLSGLKESDVTKTLYPDPDKADASKSTNNNTTSTTEGTSKVNVICDKLRQVLQEVDGNKFLLSILTTYVKKSPPQLEEVLEVVRSLREKEAEEQIDVSQLEASNASQNSVNQKVSAETALKYVCWVVDVDKLYDVALGTYDFDLVMMVAQRSQKDPKEYLPYLEELQKMEKWFQRYTIDTHLGRHAKALRNLSMAGEQYFDQCMKIMKDHKLYEVAIEIYSPMEDKSHLNTVLDLYGDFLTGKAYYSEAALMYSNGGHDQKALQAFKSAGDWRSTMVTAVKLELSNKEISSIAYDIVETFKGVSRYSEAATLLVEYCEDVESAVVTLIEGHEWHEALRRCYNHKRNDLIETNLLPAILEAYSNNIEQIEKWNKKFVKRSDRLKIVRTNKALMSSQMLSSDKKVGGADDDVNSVISGMSMYSDVSGVSGYSSVSVSTASSGYSLLSRSARRQKKQRQPKKRITGREGSPHEEEYLIEVLKRLVPTAKVQEDMSSLIKILLYFSQREKASTLQSAFNSFTRLVKDNLYLLIPTTPVKPVQEEEESERTKRENESKEASKFMDRIDWRLELFDTPR